MTAREQVEDIAVRAGRYPGRTIQETISGHTVSGRIVQKSSDEHGIYKLGGKRIDYQKLIGHFDE